MPTREQMGQLEDAAQDIIDNIDFAVIQPKIEAVAATGADEWYAARICKTPVAAAFGHLIGSKALELDATGNTPQISPGLSVYERYQAMTTKIDEAAGTQVMDAYQDSDTLDAAFEYYSEQVTRSRAFERENPKLMKRRGRILVTSTPKEVLARQVTVNAEGNTPGAIVREALRICLVRGVLPENDELAQMLRTNLRQHSSITTLPSSLFNRLVYGKELALRRYRIQQETGSPLDIPLWHLILKQQVEEGTLSDYAEETSKPLQKSIEYQTQQIASIKNVGFCAGKFHLQPQELRHARDFFEGQGVPMPDNKFSMAEYQLLRGIRAAETTFFADPQYRAAFEQIAEALREGGWTANAVDNI